MWFLLILFASFVSSMEGRYSDGLLPSSCPPLVIPNARIRIRARGRLAKIRCLSGYSMIEGVRRLICLRRHWIGAIPHCIRGGCSSVSVDNGEVMSMYNGALLHMNCHPGYTLVGSSAIFCDGNQWNDTAPTCQPPLPNSNHLSCTFERGMCGWTQGVLDDLDWKWTSASLNAFTGSLGAKIDHTFGTPAGHYVHTDSKEFFNSRSVARLYSPIFPQQLLTPVCVVFYYHMYGPSSGYFNVYLKPEDVLFELLTPRLSITGFNGDVWQMAYLELDDSLLDSSFQVIFEAVGGKTYLADVAIDDFEVNSGDACIYLEIQQNKVTTTAKQTTGSESWTSLPREDLNTTEVTIIDISSVPSLSTTTASEDMTKMSIGLNTTMKLNTTPLLSTTKATTSIWLSTIDFQSSTLPKQVPITVTSNPFTIPSISTMKLTTTESATLPRRTLTPIVDLTSIASTKSTKIPETMSISTSTTEYIDETTTIHSSKPILVFQTTTRSSVTSSYSTKSKYGVTEPTELIPSQVVQNLTSAGQNTSSKASTKAYLLSAVFGMFIVCVIIVILIVRINRGKLNGRKILREESDARSNGIEEQEDEGNEAQRRPKLFVNSYKVLNNSSSCNVDFGGTPV